MKDINKTHQHIFTSLSEPFTKSQNDMADNYVTVTLVIRKKI